jgi:NADH:ubiquinone reductase (H+-translocating)
MRSRSGAGPTGVELAGQLREVATKTLRAEFRDIKPEDAWVLLFDGGSDHAGQETRYDAATVLWTAGVEAPPIAAALAAASGATQDRAGRIQVEKNLTIPGPPGDFRPR